MSYSGFELSSNDSAAENKESQFTDKFKYFCMKMYCKGSSNRGSQHIIFLWGDEIAEFSSECQLAYYDCHNLE